MKKELKIKITIIIISLFISILIPMIYSADIQNTYIKLNEESEIANGTMYTFEIKGDITERIRLDITNNTRINETELKKNKELKYTIKGENIYLDSGSNVKVSLDVIYEDDIGIKLYNGENEIDEKIIPFVQKQKNYNFLYKQKSLAGVAKDVENENQFIQALEDQTVDQINITKSFIFGVNTLNKLDFKYYNIDRDLTISSLNRSIIEFRMRGLNIGANVNFKLQNLELYGYGQSNVNEFLIKLDQDYSRISIEDIDIKGGSFLLYGLGKELDLEFKGKNNITAVKSYYSTLSQSTMYSGFLTNATYLSLYLPNTKSFTIKENSELTGDSIAGGNIILEMNAKILQTYDETLDSREVQRFEFTGLYMKENSILKTDTNSYAFARSSYIPIASPKMILEKGSYAYMEGFDSGAALSEGVFKTLYDNLYIEIGENALWETNSKTKNNHTPRGNILASENGTIKVHKKGKIMLKGDNRTIRGSNKYYEIKTFKELNVDEGYVEAGEIYGRDINVNNNGELVGNIISTDVNISNFGEVLGNITSANTNISNFGEVLGNVTSTNINMTSNSKLEGNVNGILNLSKSFFKGRFSTNSKIKLKDVILKNAGYPSGNIITKIWRPVYTADLYMSSNKTYGTVTSSSITIENDLRSSFNQTYYTEIEPLPDVNLKLDPLNNIPNPSNEYYIKGEASPGSFIKFTGSNIPTPAEVEDTADKTGKYHVKADATGKYSYKVTLPFKAGETITAYGFLDGKSETVTTVVEEYIRVPDPNLRKAINNELKIRNPSDPRRDDNLEYYTKAEMEELKIVNHVVTSADDMSKKIMSLEGIEYGVNIEELVITGNSIKDLTPIGNLIKLYKLNVSDNKDASKNRTLEDISPIKNLVNLKEFLATSNKIKDISPIEKLRVLEQINLTDNKISDIEPLKEIRTLKKLFIEVNEISDIEPLKDIQTLERLSISFNKIKDISPIENLTNLEVIDFRRNEIENVEAVENLVNACINAGKTDFERLTFSYNKISDISSLESLKNTSIKILEIDENSISDITPLKDIKTLTTLNISKNKIADISSLEDLPKLNLSSSLYFRASNQKVEIGTTKINGYEYELSNMVKTVPTGNISVSNISGSGNIDISTGLIKWTNLKLDMNPISFSFIDSTGINFGGTVSANIERIVPMNPDNPDFKNSSIGEVPDFTGLGKAELAINYIEPIDFGTVDIESRDMKIEAVTSSPYVQVSDLRENQTGNWELKVKADKLKNKTSGYIIEEATLEFNDGEIKGSPSSLSISDIENPDGNKYKLTLGDTQYKSILKKKTNNNVKGTWLKVWKGSGLKNEKVVLNLKGGKARVGSFETTLHWELNIVP